MGEGPEQATKMIRGFTDYEGRLEDLGWVSSVKRRIQGGLVKVNRCLKGNDKETRGKLFSLALDAIGRSSGQTLQL